MAGSGCGRLHGDEVRGRPGVRLEHRHGRQPLDGGPSPDDEGLDALVGDSAGRCRRRELRVCVVRQHDDTTDAGRVLLANGLDELTCRRPMTRTGGDDHGPDLGEDVGDPVARGTGDDPGQPGLLLVTMLVSTVVRMVTAMAVSIAMDVVVGVDGQPVVGGSAATNLVQDEQRDE